MSKENKKKERIVKGRKKKKLTNKLCFGSGFALDFPLDKGFLNRFISGR
jgi:hypothetical protein